MNKKRDLMETKRKQSMYYEAMKKMIDVLNKQQVLITGGAPNTKYYDLQYFGLSEFEERRSDITSPMIYISPSETNYGSIKQENEFSDYSRMDFPKLSVPSLMVLFLFYCFILFCFALFCVFILLLNPNNIRVNQEECNQCKTCKICLTYKICKICKIYKMFKRYQP